MTIIGIVRRMVFVLTFLASELAINHLIIIKILKELYSAQLAERQVSLQASDK